MITPVRPQPTFDEGQIVRHRRYAYRGVVVHCDRGCQASDQWYQSNQTQPDRHQPWYHVLVHGTQSMTYAAQSSLEADPSGKPVEHPLLNTYFDGLVGQRYVRNDHPFPAIRP